MKTEIGEFFTLSGDRCLHPGCEKGGDVFGYCEKHYAEQIELRYARLQKERRTRPAPACFDEQGWKEYQVFDLDALEKRKGTSDPCRDCCPEFQFEMDMQGKCDHREVVFIRREGTVEGVNATQFHRWDSACRGELGPVVKPPENHARLVAVNKHALKLRRTRGRKDAE